MALSENGGKLEYRPRAKYCHLITRVFNRAEVFVAEFKPTFSPVDNASKDLRHNPSEARIPMSAALRTETQSQSRTPSPHQRQSLMSWVARAGRSAATACGCGKPCTGRGALPGLVMSAPEQPMLCRSDRVPDMRRHHANRGRRHI